MSGLKGHRAFLSVLLESVLDITELSHSIT